MDKHKNVPIRFDESDHRKLKAFCAAHGFSMQEFVTRAIEEYKKKWVV